MAASPDLRVAVSVILPVLDEVRAIDACLASLLDQDYDGPLEIVVADGGSTDGTRARLAAVRARAGDRVRLLDNPGRLQAHGLSLAARHARGEVLVRADAHTTYARDYVRRSVTALRESGAAAVGGRLVPEGRTRGERAVALAMRSPLAVGPARFHHARRREEVDTVYLGAWRREDLLGLGGFRALPSGAGEDADLSWRIRRAGGRILLDPAIRSTYRPRGSVAAVARQHWRYGLAKAEMLWVNGALPSPRPLAPAALVTALGAGLGAAAAGRTRLPLLRVAASWAAVLAAVAVRPGRPAPLAAEVAADTAAMHLSYGAGLLWGLVRGPGPVRHLRRPDRAGPAPAPAPAGGHRRARPARRVPAAPLPARAPADAPRRA